MKGALDIQMRWARGMRLAAIDGLYDGTRVLHDPLVVTGT